MSGPLAGNLPWMAWNLFLALIPAALAVALFRVGNRKTALWWTGLAVMLAFLPNAPYVLTDVVHLPGDVRAAPGPRVVFLGLIPQFTLFFVVGFGAYVLAVLRLEGWLRHEGWSPRRVALVDVTIHVACAIGVFLGRVWRFNSWDLAHRPADVLAVTVGGLLHPRPITVVIVSLVAVVFAAGTMLVRLVAAIAAPNG